MDINKIYQGDALSVLKTLPDESINCCVTSPPYYGLRDYGVEGQLGLEETPEQYVVKLVSVFEEVRRVLKKDGNLWLNLGDSYWGSGNASGHTDKTKNLGAETSNYGSTRGHTEKKSDKYKPKDLIGIPWMVAFALRSAGWYLRQDIIWAKPNPMPESVTDRCTKSHEYIFLLSKSKKYYYDAEAIKEQAFPDGRKDTLMKGSLKYKEGVVPNSQGHSMASSGHERWQKNEDDEYVKNKRSVWHVATRSFKEAHFAVFPPKLIEDCIKAGCPEGGIVLDPFMGSGTTAIVARKQDKNYVGIELNHEYIQIAEKRIRDELGMFA